jgi:hypothetical protein
MDLRIDVRTGTQLRRHLAPVYSAIYTIPIEMQMMGENIRIYGRYCKEQKAGYKRSS